MTWGIAERVTWQHIVESFGRERLFRCFVDWKRGVDVPIPEELKRLDPNTSWPELWDRFAGSAFQTWLLLEIYQSTVAREK
jgi:hypothetical protein